VDSVIEMPEMSFLIFCPQQAIRRSVNGNQDA
jgi:hypothetical protein